MAIKGEAKKVYQREYMRKRRESVRPSPLEKLLDPNPVADVRPIQPNSNLTVSPIIKPKHIACIEPVQPKLDADGNDVFEYW